MPNLRENQYLNRQVTINAALRAAVDFVPSLAASQQGSAPDDSGESGYYEEGIDGVLDYYHWFRAGDIPGERIVRPY